MKVWSWARDLDGEPVFVASMRERVGDQGRPVLEFLVHDGRQWGWCHASQITPPPGPDNWPRPRPKAEGQCDCGTEPVEVTPGGFEGHKWMCPDCGANWTTD